MQPPVESSVSAKDGKNHLASGFISPTKSMALFPLTCFGLTLAISLLLQFTCTQPRMLLMLDSGHYLLTSKLIWQHLGDFLTLSLSPDQLLGHCLIQDGPLLSLVPAICFSLLGCEPLSTNWQVISVIQCCYHAVSATLVYFLSYRFLGSRNWALLAGLLWGLNPAALVNCGRFLTEGQAIPLLLASLVMMAESVIRKSESGHHLFALLAGLFLGLVALVKPPLLIACFICTFVSWCGFNSLKARTQFLAVLAIGIVIVLLPWTVVTKQVTGSVHVIPKRCAVHNLAKGLNYQAEAWQGFPPPPLTAIYSNWFGAESGAQELWAVSQAVIKADPEESFYLAIRKIPRLFFLPWNDFGVSLIGIGPHTQVFIHYVIVASSLMGIFLFSLAKFSRKEEQESNKKSNIVGFILLAAVIGHFAYLPFEAMPRYFFSAMPSLVIFAVYLLQLLKRSRSWYLCLSLVTTICVISLNSVDLLPITVLIANSTAGGVFIEFFGKSLLILSAVLFMGAGLNRLNSVSLPVKFLLTVVFLGCSYILWVCTYTHKLPREWKCMLEPGQAVSRFVRVDASTEYVKKALLLLDTDKAIYDSKIFVNDIELNAKPVSVYEVNPLQFSISKYVRIFTSGRALSFDDARQWRVVSVPEGAVKFGAVNKITISANTKPVTIYGDYELESAKRRYPPKFFDFSPDKFIHDPFRVDGRLISYTGIPIQRNSCVFESSAGVQRKDLSTDFGKQSGEYRMFLSISPEIANTCSSGEEELLWKKQLTASDFDPLLSTQLNETGAELRMNKSILRSCRSNISTFKFPGDVQKEIGKYRAISIRLKGMVRGVLSTGSSSVCVEVSGKGERMVLPQVPYEIKPSSTWTEFTIASNIPCGSFSNGLESISVVFFPGPWEMVAAYGPSKKSGDALYKDLSIEIHSSSLPFITDVYNLSFH